MTYRLEMAGGQWFLIDDETYSKILGLLNGPVGAMPPQEIEDKGGKGKVSIVLAHVVAIRLNKI